MSTEYKSLADLFDKQQYSDKDGNFDFLKLQQRLPFPPIYQDKQAVRVPGTYVKGCSSTFRNARSPNFLINKIHPSLSTMYESFENSVRLNAECPCLGKRLFNESTGEYDDFFTWETYRTVSDRRLNFGAGTKHLVMNNPDVDIESDDGKFIVAIYSSNRPEWIITQFGCQAYSLPTTALYDTLGPKTSQYILEFASCPVVVCSLDRILTIINIKQAHGLSKLKFIVSMDPLDFHEHYGLIQLAKEFGLILVDMMQVESIGKLNPLLVDPPLPEDIFCISFTSGTTGNPKGVEITHEMGASALAFASSAIENICDRKPDGTNKKVYCFLPLAHIYELLTTNMALCKGAGVGFPQDSDPKTLIDNLKILKPDVVTLVPRVFSKIESSLKDSFSHSFMGKHVIRKLVDYKNFKQLQDGHGDVPVLDAVIIKQIRHLLGFDNVVAMISGSAPINPETALFVKAATGSGFKQGYGLTESFAGVCISNSFETDLGSSGPIGITTEMKLRDIPEMHYFSCNPDGTECEEPKGELLLRGPQIFKKYYKQPEETAKVLDAEGWFHTGDVAKIDKYGRLSIIDRFKNFFKLAQGEYITPERIENIYLSCCSYLTQLYIHGDSLKTYLVGIVGIDPNSMNHILQSLNINLRASDTDKLIKLMNHDVKLKKNLLNEINKSVKGEGLQGFEKLRNIRICIEPLKIENDVITPTMKIKRSNARKFFEKELKELYEQGDLISLTKL